MSFCGLHGLETQHIYLYPHNNMNNSESGLFMALQIHFVRNGSLTNLNPSGGECDGGY